MSFGQNDDQAAQGAAGIMGQIENLPASVYYWASIGSIAASALFMLLGRKNLSIFVGLWPPTFAVLGLFNKQLHPSQEIGASGSLTGKSSDDWKDTASQASQSAKNMSGSR
ncbi:MAG: hypothetical protein ACR2PL_24695 [Dehalococcoidia bacterium]